MNQHLSTIINVAHIKINFLLYSIEIIWKIFSNVFLTTFKDHSFYYTMRVKDEHPADGTIYVIVRVIFWLEAHYFPERNYIMITYKKRKVIRVKKSKECDKMCRKIPKGEFTFLLNVFMFFFFCNFVSLLLTQASMKSRW